MATKQRSVIFGATSGLAQSVARILASRGESLVLLARDAEKLEAVASDLKVRGASETTTFTVDFDDIASHEALLDKIGNANCYWVFYGSLPDQSACEAHWESSSEALNTNFISPVSLLTHAANRLEKAKEGHIVVVSSVAGDRGRKSNYLYGAAKGGLSLFCQGLRNRLSSSGVRVLTVKPGFIDTPMTADVPKTPAILWATPDKVALDIVKAKDKGRNVLYTPWFWQGVMLIIKLIPESIFKKLSL